VIPARGGSKGIPGKNLKRIAGQPLIALTIHAARQAKHVQRVIVSTDDPAIAAVAREHGAEVVVRPAELSNDTASSESALLHALEHLEETEGYRPQLLVFLQCTSPLTEASDIDGTIQRLLDQAADSACSVAPFHYFLWRTHGTEGADGINHDKRVRLRRQDREPEFLETGAVYVMRAAGFRSARRRFFGKTVLYETPAERVCEIDEPIDLQLAELRLRARARQSSAVLPAKVAALVMDFDGVLTDNRVSVDQDGRESVQCSRADGMGLELLRKAGLPLLVLSKEQNPVVAARCRKLQVRCEQGIEAKWPALLAYCAELRIAPEQVVYVGNDINDLECMRAVGCGVAVADSHPEALRAAKLVLSANGGAGAVRELCDLILEHTSILRQS
jgi:N-acylneuraminate cytidylyltransferase